MDNENLKKVGLKVTMPRLKILTILEKEAGKHLSAEAVYRELKEMGEDIGLATVYRVLTQFEEAGLVIRHHFENYSVFEMDDGKHHDHLVCVQCGIVAEFMDEFIENRQREIAKKANFTITEHQLTIYGVCQHCQEKS